MTRNHQIEPTALARFFSSSVVKELASKGRSPTLTRLVHESRILEVEPGLSLLGEVFDRAFKYLQLTNNRHEYVYKAAVTEKVLLGVHSLDTASMLTELRVGRCKADVVILNGTATAYEIKSERDKLTRLVSQVDAYLNVFASVYVIAGENHIDDVIKAVPKSVGVSKLSKTYQISPIRAAQDDPERTCPLAIFDVLTVRESEMVLRHLGVPVPEVPNTQKYATLKGAFETLKALDAHRTMVEVLKKTRTLKSLKSFVGDVPKSLHCASLSTKLRKRDRQTFINALRTPMRDAVGWS